MGRLWKWLNESSGPIINLGPDTARDAVIATTLATIAFPPLGLVVAGAAATKLVGDGIYALATRARSPRPVVRRLAVPPPAPTPVCQSQPELTKAEKVRELERGHRENMALIDAAPLEDVDKQALKNEEQEAFRQRLQRVLAGR